MEEAALIAFVSGGARSGKSRYAEEKAIEVYEQRQQAELPGQLVYIATAKVTDNEMAERIRYHREDRSEAWETIEEAFDLTSVPLKTGVGDVVLVDCLTIWLSNMLYQTPSQGSSPLPVNRERAIVKDLIRTVDHLINSAIKKRQTVIFVSNDVNEGEPAVIDPMVNDYVYVLERLHRHIADQADSAIQVIAGIPIEWKGEEFS